MGAGDGGGGARVVAADRASPGAESTPPRPGPAPISDTVYYLICLRKSTPPQNRQLNIPIIKIQQQVDNFVGGLTLPN